MELSKLEGKFAANTVKRYDLGTNVVYALRLMLSQSVS